MTLLRGSEVVYTRWPKPMILSLASSIARTPRSAASALSKRSISSIAASLAPPCSGPRSAPIAPVMAEWKSDSVAAMTRAVKVEALNSCSAYRISETSSTRRWNSDGGLPCSRCRKCPATLSSSVTVSMRTPSAWKRHQ
jgi:hypothetical protein